MAAGTFKWFAQGLDDLGNGVHNFGTAVLKMGIVTSGTVPAVNTTAPCWGSGGSTNFSTTQVATTGTSYTGPKTCSSPTWTLTATGAALDYADTNFAMAQDASGFTNGAYGIVYNDSAANKQAIGYVEISSAGTASLVAGAINITLNASGALGLVQS